MIVISKTTTVLLKKNPLWMRRCFYLDFVSKAPVNVFHGSHVSITFCILWTVKSCSALVVNSSWPPAETELRSDGIVVERRLCQVQQTANEPRRGVTITAAWTAKLLRLLCGNMCDPLLLIRLQPPFAFVQPDSIFQTKTWIRWPLRQTTAWRSCG